MPCAAPVTDQEFSGALQALFPGAPVGVAVSGGADSVALLRLMLRWLQAQGRPEGLLALTVDHGLRAASAAEAQQVSGWCRDLGIPHQILHWRGGKPLSDIQAAARGMRYGLMTDYCRRRNISCLLLGHQFEDQAENFLLRLGRGSGVDGLSAMAPVRLWNGVRLLRPLLSFTRERLQATLIALEQPWIEDPSNKDPLFARVRARNVLGDLSRAGISPARLVATAQRMRRVRTALDDATAQLMRLAVQWEQAGYATLRLDAMLAAPDEIGLRVLSRVLMAMGGLDYPPRLASVERVYDWLGLRPVSGGRTLSGCRILPKAKGVIVVRELSAIGPEIILAPGEDRLWDNRFQVRLGTAGNKGGRGPYTVRAVGSEGLRRWRNALPANLPPRIVCHAMPGLWQGGHLIAAPQMGLVDPASQGVVAFETRFAPRHVLLPECMAV